MVIFPVKELVDEWLVICSRPILRPETHRRMLHQVLSSQFLDNSKEWLFCKSGHFAGTVLFNSGSPRPPVRMSFSTCFVGRGTGHHSRPVQLTSAFSRPRPVSGEVPGVCEGQEPTGASADRAECGGHAQASRGLGPSGKDVGDQLLWLFF